MAKQYVFLKTRYGVAHHSLPVGRDVEAGPEWCKVLRRSTDWHSAPLDFDYVFQSRRDISALPPLFEASAFDPAASYAVTVDEHVIHDSGIPGQKYLSLLKRRDGISHSEFCDYWLNTHAALVRSEPTFFSHFHKYVQNHCRLETWRRCDGKIDGFEFDGIVEVWVEDHEALADMFRHPLYANVIQKDEVMFIGMPRVRYFVEEL